MSKLTPLTKLLLFGLLIGGFIYGGTHLSKIKNALKIAVPTKVEVINAEVLQQDTGIAKAPMPSASISSQGGTAIRFLVWAWNAQMGAMFANGGPVTTQGSLMEKQGVKVAFTRQDDTSQMQNELVTLATSMEKGEANPAAGAHFVAIMGDGAAQFLQGINPKLEKLGPDYIAEVVGSAGYSRHEDQFMGPQEWKANPEAARGGLVAGVCRDGDWNLAMRWMEINKIDNNPDDKVYAPNAVNWVCTDTYVDAAQKYISNYCQEMAVKGTSDKKSVCVQGVVTWTPGDVMVADQKGGLVTLMSTGTALFQMPNTIIGIKKWDAANAEKIAGMLAAIGQGGDQIRLNQDAFNKAAEISAKVYKEQTGPYWATYYKGVTKKDKQGLMVELGGSYASNLQDQLQLFGLSGGRNLFKVTYEQWGKVVVQQYPNIMKTFPPTEKILNTRYLQMAMGRQGEMSSAPAEKLTYDSSAPMTDVVGKRAYNITYRTGSAEILPGSFSTLDGIAGDLMTSNTIAELHGFTDSTGTPSGNMILSEARARAVKDYLMAKGGRSIPDSRINAIGYGQRDPVADNSTEAGRAKNRRVEIVLGR